MWVSERKIRIALWKRMWDTGYAILGPFKQLLVGAMGGSLFTENYLLAIALTVITPIFVFLCGFLWFMFGMVEADTEVGNRYNPFVKEMREKIK